MKGKLIKYLFLINITLFILFINTNSIYAWGSNDKDESNKNNETIIDEKDDRGQSGASNSKLNDNSTDGDWE